MSKGSSIFPSYHCYGLIIDSEIPIPDFSQTERDGKVFIRLGQVRNTGIYCKFQKSLEKISQEKDIFLESGCIIGGSKDVFFIEWSDIGCCLIENGLNVVVELYPGARVEDVVPFITTQVLAILLHQNGNLVLHASSVLINNHAVVFLGDKGYGKSTIAAHLQVKGHKLISDDLVPVNCFDGFFQTVPGFPRLKLFPDSITSIGLNPKAMPLVHETFTKHFYKCPEDFSTKPIKIGCIFILKKDSRVGIEKMNPVAAFIELVRNTYLSSYIEATENTVQHFNYCQEIVKSIPVFELKRPHNFSLMSEVTAGVEEQVPNF